MATRNHIDLVEKTVRVLEVLAQGGVERSLKDIVCRVGLAKSSVFRILFTLKELGYAEQTEAGDYRLTIKVLALARGGRMRLDTIQLAHPHLVQLTETLGESAWLAERRGPNVLLVSGVETSHPLRLRFSIGDRCPLHASALGKCIAAFMSPPELAEALGNAPLKPFTARTITSRDRLTAELDCVRKLGYATNDEETIDGAFHVAAPIFDATGLAFAAFSTCSPIARCTAATRHNMIGAVKQAAAGLSSDLARIGFQSSGPRHSVC